MTEVNSWKPQTMAFWDLPDEVIEQILPEIGLHGDLITFACTSRLCSQLIIPRHTEYRILYIGSIGYDHIWAHLASLPGLARNIREVHLQDATPDFPRVPTLETKPKEDADVDYKEEHTNILTSIRHMTHLTLFSWDGRNVWTWGLKNFATLLFEVLEGLGSVQHLDLHISKRFSLDDSIEGWKLWNMNQLCSLQLERDLWHSTRLFDLEPSLLSAWLRSLTDLEHLSVPYQVIAAYGAEVFFPKLKTILLYTVHAPSTDVSAIMVFLERHRSLEGFNWFSTEGLNITFSPGFLPNLKQLTCSWDVFEILQLSAAGTPARSVQALKLSMGGGINMVARLCESSYLDRSALRRLGVCGAWKTDDLKRLALLYPGIEELSVHWTSVDLDAAHWFEGILDCFEQFKHLQVIHYGSLWNDMVPDASSMIWDAGIQALVHERARTLARRCPNLRQICHPKTWSHIIRIDHGSEGEIRVRDLQKQMWNPFDWFVISDS